MLTDRTARHMSNESLREIAAYGIDLRTVSSRKRIEAVIARSELRARDLAVAFE